VKSPLSFSRPLAFVAIVGIAFCSLRAEAHAPPEGPEVVVEWNQAVLANLPATAGLFGFRYQAMVNIAMFDAVSSIQGRYRPYHTRVLAFPTASAEAAAAQAAHDVLVGLIPAAQPTFDTLLQNRLQKIETWRAVQGAAVGRKVALAILDWRTADGSEAPNLPYLPPPLPGLWQPAAPGQVAGFVQFQHVEPFGLLTPSQFLPAAPPQLNSAEYAAAFNQVKDVGSATSTTRTAEQELLAKVIAGVGYGPGPFGLWNVVAQRVAVSRNLSLIDTARMFALVTASMNDGLQTSHSSKFAYQLWRPITAIRRAGEDLNDQTVADPSWTPLLTTPPYPSHSSNVACIGTSAAQAFARVFKTDAVPFTMTWTGTGGNANVTRSYSGFSQLAEEAGLSRVYGGIHFVFELDASHEACTKVADFLADNYMERMW
jgi:hypothetical protein